MQFIATLRNARLDQIKAKNDAGGAGTGKLKIYGGIAPPGVAVSPTGTPAGATLLATLTAVTVAAASGGTEGITMTTQNGAASGTPTFARLTDSTDNTYAELTAAIGAGSELNFSAGVTLGGAVSGSITVTEGNA